MAPKVPAPATEPIPGAALSLQQALTRSAPLALLAERLRASSARFAVVQPLIPAALAAQIQPGPVDQEGWTLLVANAAACAKLRQLQPKLEAALHDRGWQVSAIRLKIQTGPGNGV
jgi:hypothetical protein